jgi:ABC-2 type transport system permease protein
MFFISSALYPLWKLQEAGAEVVYQLARVNPFTHVVQLIRHALYGQFDATAFVVVLITLAVCFGFAVLGYDPQRGLVRRVQRPA